MKMTIKDISRISGYSCSTVARVLKDENTVSIKTKNRILEIIAESNYRPYHFAHLSKKGNTRIVMIIVADITNYFYAGLIKSMSETFSQNEYKAMIANSNGSSTLEEEYLQYAEEESYAGVIMITAVETETLKQLLNQINCPVVLVNRYIKSMDLDVVCIDNYRGGYMAGEYLVKMGHQKICHLAGSITSTASQDRTRGFLDALNDSNIELKADGIFYGDLRYESGYQLGKTFVKKAFDYTAIFCGNDLMARGFADSLDEGNWKIPDDISIICFDDSPAAVSGKIKFTTICREPDLMGSSAANMLLDRIKDADKEPVKIIYPPQLLIRESCKKLDYEDNKGRDGGT